MGRVDRLSKYMYCMLQGVSSAAYMFCHHHSGSRLHVPLRNCVNSLNVISAASLVLFKVQEVLDRVDRDRE